MIKLLKKMGYKQVLLIVCAVILIAFQVYLELKIPDYMTNITSLVQTSGSSISDILGEGAKMILCAVLREISFLFNIPAIIVSVVFSVLFNISGI